MEHKEGLKYQTTGKRKIKKYTTKERMEKINPDNIKIYNKYLNSKKAQNRDVRETTYKVYQSYMNIFMCYIEENWDNFYLLNEDILEEDMLDIMEAYMLFLEDECGNGKKVINTKLSAVSSFYVWATKRRLIQSHPFSGKLDRIKNAQEEKKIAVYFLHQPEIDLIKKELSKPKTSLSKYDYQDEIIWNIAFDSACRIGALHQLSLSNLNMDEMIFKDVREKRGKIVDIPFEGSTKVKVQEYLDWRKEQGIDCDALFYVWKNGAWGRMSKQSLTNRIRKIGEIVGVGDFRPHCIRKSRLNQIGQTGNVQLAKELAHHESLDTTSRFYMEEKSESETLKDISRLMNGNSNPKDKNNLGGEKNESNTWYQGKGKSTF
ncbi:tyrosine-type recombinase/integrase [Liquorilactobacillus mali]|uniref:Integrase family protein n=1 Tax=Liquorilactobacillus mali KCTC 3596 = DSM 20444 TaxID=1046596 RepID=J0L3M3_9LACO|nr:site-specific integrase [Liquorilactobacillus mali]EJE97752.1 site-specific tyrosine recombinase [Liquorilactobacillus mali KCTC 3596 = DSM 20444]KRN10837.1 integrase family protein [Liquorilactobacillus mali KCTC 3596 = DSM 20444]